MKSDELVKDVVCGMIKPKSQMQLTSIFNGKAFYFCSQSDKSMFDAHPEHWAPLDNPPGGD
ncbi:MAG: YHS domain-containing protein [bacterium]|nr:YHS domain-containing protein [bacterium]